MDISQKEWSYIGRFLARFSQIESTINEILGELFGLTYESYKGEKHKITAHFLIMSNIDLRKKLTIAKIIAEEIDIEFVNIFKIINRFHDIRNIMVHTQFYEDVDPNIEVDDMQLGIVFDHVSILGSANLKFFSCEYLDRQDEEMQNINKKLWELHGNICGKTDPSLVIKDKMMKALEEGENVILLRN